MRQEEIILVELWVEVIENVLSRLRCKSEAIASDLQHTFLETGGGSDSV